jgi:hypothetical protein
MKGLKSIKRVPRRMEKINTEGEMIPVVTESMCLPQMKVRNKKMMKMNE